MIIIISSRQFHPQYGEGFYEESLSRCTYLLKITTMQLFPLQLLKNKLDFAPVK